MPEQGWSFEPHNTNKRNTQAVYTHLQPSGSSQSTGSGDLSAMINQLGREDFACLAADNNVAGCAIPRDVILRLIDWLEQ